MYMIFMPPPLGAGGIMFSGCPSVRPSVHPSVRLSLRPKPEIPSFEGQIWGFRVFPGELMEEMAWNFARWCILTTSRTDKFMDTVCWIF